MWANPFADEAVIVHSGPSEEDTGDGKIGGHLLHVASDVAVVATLCHLVSTNRTLQCLDISVLSLIDIESGQMVAGALKGNTTIEYFAVGMTDELCARDCLCCARARRQVILQCALVTA